MAEDNANGHAGPRSQDEVALELMKFIVVTTGYGRGGTAPAAGFSGKPVARTPEEYAEVLKGFAAAPVELASEANRLLPVLPSKAYPASCCVFTVVARS